MDLEKLQNDIEEELNVKLPDPPSIIRVYESFKYNDDCTKDPNRYDEGKNFITKIIASIFIVIALIMMCYLNN